VVLGFELRAFTSPIFVKGFSRWGLANYLSRLALNFNPPDLCLLSCQYYRHEPLAPGYKILLLPGKTRIVHWKCDDSTILS
jgi:hypothetical protein